MSLIVVWTLAVAVVAANRLNPFPYYEPEWMDWWLIVSIMGAVWLIALVWALWFNWRAWRALILSAPLVLWFGGEAVSWWMGWLVW